MINNFASRLRVLLAAALVPFTASADEAASRYEWHVEDGQYAELSSGERPLVRYMLTPLDESSDTRRAETYKPYLHVYSPDGSQLLTKGPGGLFPHHRGIFFGFNKITYGDGKKCDTWHCTGGAYQQHQEFDGLKAGDDGGLLTSLIYWHGTGGEHFATETRTYEVTDTAEGTRIDFRSKLTPVDGLGPIKLDGDPQHAGVQFRASQHVPDETAKQTYYVREDGKGKLGETRNWEHRNLDAEGNDDCTNREWLALSFVLDGERFTVLYIDHPDNPKPARYSERDYGRFGSYFVAEVTAEKPLEVHYRYFIKRGEMTVEECQSRRGAFVKN